MKYSAVKEELLLYINLLAVLQTMSVSRVMKGNGSNLTALKELSTVE